MTTLRSAPGGRAGPTSWPLTPIEELDLYLESAAEPSLIQLETLVRGHLDAAALESALAGVLAADPAARRQLAAASRWRRRLRWEAAGAAGGRTAHGGTPACSPWPAGGAPASWPRCGSGCPRGRSRCAIARPG